MLATSQRQLAEILGKSRTTIRDWIDAGMPVVDGGFDVSAVIDWLIDREVERRAPSPTKSSSGSTGTSAKIEEAKLRKLELDIERAEVELRAASEEWIHRDHVERMIVERARVIADWCEAHVAQSADCRSDVDSFREAFSRGDQAASVVEWQRLNRRGGSLRKGRGRPRTKR
jgi:hypothetical protein